MTLSVWASQIVRGGLVALAMVCTQASAAGLPAVAGPIAANRTPGAGDRDYPFFASNQALPARGYVEEEYFVSGRARRHTSRYPTRTFEGGRLVGDEVSFRTRIVVRRPVNPQRSNGVVVVEWNNVSNLFDADNVWLSSWEHLVRSGYTWVGVTAQGHGGTEMLKAWSPQRYAGLSIPNEGRMAWEPYALDIYDQIGRLLRSADGTRVLGGRSAGALIAVGQSQSAIWLATYINGGLQAGSAYDAYLLLSATGMAVRPDLRAPVLKIVPEGDLVRAREAELVSPDTKLFRQWEVAGASHVDRYMRSNREPTELRDLGTSVQASIAPKCAIPSIGTSTPMNLVIGAGLDHLARWARGGTPAPVAPRITREKTPAGAPIPRDPTGFARGGIRLPNIVAPTSLEVGANTGDEACVGQGYSIPFSYDVLQARYGSADRRLSLFRNSAEASARAGFIPKYAVNEVLTAAARERW